MTEVGFPVWGYAALAVMPVAALATYAVGLWLWAKSGRGGDDE